jgi:hypothetical protein
MVNRLRLFGVVAVVTGGLASAAAVCLVGPGGASERLRRLLFVGAPLFEVRLPDSAHVVLRSGAVELFVGFAPGDRVAWDTFRALLNDRDVTPSLTLGRNGAHGKLFGMTEGPNHLRLQLFGRSWWGGHYVQDEQVLVLSVVGRPDLDRALELARPRAQQA